MFVSYLTSWYEKAPGSVFYPYCDPTGARSGPAYGSKMKKKSAHIAIFFWIAWIVPMKASDFTLYADLEELAACLGSR